MLSGSSSRVIEGHSSFVKYPATEEAQCRVCFMCRGPILVKDSAGVSLLPQGQSLSQNVVLVRARIDVFINENQRRFSVAQTRAQTNSLFERSDVVKTFLFLLFLCIGVSATCFLAVGPLLDSEVFLIQPQNLYHAAHPENLKHLLASRFSLQLGIV